MKFITNSTKHSQYEQREEFQTEPDAKTTQEQKLPFPSYIETIQKKQQKRK